MLLAIGLILGGIAGFQVGKYWLTYELLQCCKNERNRDKLFDILTQKAEDWKHVRHEDEPHMPA